MPSSKSAKKRLKQNEARRARNRARKSALRTQVKKFRAAVEAGDAEAARGLYNFTAKALDQAASRHVIHKNTASRTKSRLARSLAAVAAEKGAPAQDGPASQAE